MNNSIFLDSSILVEHYKGTQTEFLERFFFAEQEHLVVNSDPFIIDKETGEMVEVQATDDRRLRLYISQVVVSEYLFQCLKIDSGGKPAPLTLKQNVKIPELIRKFDHADFLDLFECLYDDPAIFSMAPGIMEDYNLLPNDAIILALCKFHDIRAIASFDRTDFEVFCKREAITLLSSVKDIEAFSSTFE